MLLEPSTEKKINELFGQPNRRVTFVKGFFSVLRSPNSDLTVKLINPHKEVKCQYLREITFTIRVM